MKYQEFKILFEKTQKKSKKAAENAIYTIKQNTTKGIQDATGLTQKEISERYGIPLRTLEDWKAGKRKIPTQKECMLTFCVLSDMELI